MLEIKRINVINLAVGTPYRFITLINFNWLRCHMGAWCYIVASPDSSTIADINGNINYYYSRIL